MKSKLVEKTGSRLKFEVEIELDPTSMLSSEEQIQEALNELGKNATELALEQFDTDGKAIEVEGDKLTSKGQEKKSTRQVMGK